MVIPRVAACPRVSAWLTGLVGVAAACGLASAAPPSARSAVSRITHGAAGPFDVQLPLAGGTGIECRGVSGGLSIVVTFDQPVKSATATVAAGQATLGTLKFENYTVTIPVTNLVDAQLVTVTLADVRNAAGESLATQDVSFRTLFGDVNGSGSLSGGDLSAVRGAVGNAGAITGATFRCDLNVSGGFSGADVSAARSAVGNSAFVDGGPTANTQPTLTQVAGQTVATGAAMSPIGFTVADAESDAGTLVVTVGSSDPVTIPPENVTVSGTGATRQVTLTPAAGVTSTVPVQVTLYVSDGLAYSEGMTFTVNVTPPPVAYLATLKPVAGTGSLGTGTAVLTVSGDQTYATIAYTYSNLTSNDVDDTVIDANNNVLYDLPVGKKLGDVQPDGTYKWTFNAAKAADILASLQSNTAIFLIDSADFPAGELSGRFQPLTGSQNFVAPLDNPDPIVGLTTPAEASRFLQQAAFGGNAAEVAALANPAVYNPSTAIRDWLTAQFNTPVPIYPSYAATSTAPTATATVPTPGSGQPTGQPYSTSSLYWQLYNRVTTPQGANAYGDTYATDRLVEGWWKNAVTAPDSLRQRVALAYSEIFVVSANEATVDGNPAGLSSYYDMLAGDAFVSFRQILGDVTLHPIMGKYLTMLGNTKANPNENYAREIMQLFSIGLYMLQPDGTLMLDAQGKPIPTYTQPQVTSFAQVYTGWNVSSVKPVIPTLVAPVAPATTPTVTPVTSSYQQPMVVTASNHSATLKTLLSYPGATVTMIPATTGTMTTAIANNELNVALDNIANHPNVGPFICRQLIQRLVESNPSPAYVYRVAQVFNNDGTGARGNMRAVIAAILTDYEARSPAVRGSNGYGKMREPMLRMAQLLHSMNATSKGGKFTVGRTESTLNQTVLRAPTVFNFFDPSYAQPGPIQTAGVVSPEFDIIFETTITNAQNMIYTAIYAGYTAATGAPTLTGTGFRGDSGGSDVYLDFSAAGSNLVPLATTSGTAAMLNQVVTLLSGGPLDDTGAAQARILTFLNSAALTTPLARVQAAVHLVATSAQCATQK